MAHSGGGRRGLDRQAEAETGQPGAGDRLAALDPTVRFAHGPPLTLPRVARVPAPTAQPQPLLPILFARTPTSLYYCQDGQKVKEKERVRRPALNVFTTE